MDIHGDCRETFEPVREAFANSFDQDLELGASVCVTVNGESVVDISMLTSFLQPN